jgi:hypothetical protein
MKKLLLVMVMMMAVVALNAQRTPVKVADLNKAITDNIASKYAGFTVKDATQVVNNGVTTFEVVIAKGSTSETLLYDKDGKFLKEENMKTGTTEKPGMKGKSGTEKTTQKPVPKKK